MIGFLLGGAINAIIHLLIFLLFVVLIICVIVFKGLRGIINTNGLTKVLGYGTLGIFGFIIAFTLIPFGTDSDTVVNGYNMTRTYSKETRALKVSADNFKNAVEKDHNDKKLVDNFKPVETTSLGSYGTLLTDEQYEAYTASLPGIPASYDVYPANTAYTEKNFTPSGSSNVSISVEAKFDTVLHYLTIDGNGPCTGNSGDHRERGMYLCAQCAAFAAWYVNDVSYLESGAVTAHMAMSGGSGYNESTIAWKRDTGISLYNDVAKAKEFFKGVTPGTAVRNYRYVSKDEIYQHSYILLGADDEGVVIYDCNWGNGCGISIRHTTWEKFCANPQLCIEICGLCAPDSTYLPPILYTEDYKSGLTLAALNNLPSVEGGA